jgi:hypothetical protein
VKSTRLYESEKFVYTVGMARRLTYDEFLRWLERRAQTAGSRQALADELGVSPAYLSDVLNRRRGPSRGFLNKVMAREIRLFEIDAA